MPKVNPNKTKAVTLKHTFVYKAICNITGKEYIGSHTTDDLFDGYVGSGREWLNHIKEYGSKPKLIHIESFDDMEDAKRFEHELIKEELEYNPMLMNRSSKGSGGNYGEECNKKIGEANRKNWEENYEYMMERTQNEEVIKRRSETMKRVIAENPHKFLSHIEAINSNPDKIASTANTHRGMKRTEETGNNISEAKKIANMNKGKDKVASMAGKGSKYVTDTKNRYISRRVDSDYKLKVGEVFGVKKPPQAQGRSSNGYKKTVVTNTDTGDQYGIYLDLFELKSNEKIGKWKLGSLKK